MALVDIIWSLTNGGSALTTVLNHGNLSNGQNTVAQEIFLRHNGINPITSCGILTRQFSGTYSGGKSAAVDFAEFLSWGDQSTLAGFGGIQFNMDAVGAYPAAAWPTYASKTPTNGETVRTGVGDSVSNAITIPAVTGATANGTIQAGASPNVRLGMRVHIPADEDTVGVRMVDTVMIYNFTS